MCLNWGCIPTKALLHTADVLRDIEGAAALGIDTGPRARRPGARGRAFTRRCPTAQSRRDRPAEEEQGAGVQRQRADSPNPAASPSTAHKRPRSAPMQSSSPPVPARSRCPASNRTANGLDRARSDGAGCAAETVARDRRRRDRHRVRELLSHARQRSHGGRSAAGDPADGRRRDRHGRAARVRKGRHRRPHRDVGCVAARERRRFDQPH